MAQVKIDFYRVYLPQDYDGTFEDLVQQIYQQPVARRVQEGGGGWIYLLGLDTARDRSRQRGTVVRVKADEIPPAGDRTGALQDLPLTQDQGIAGVTHFYYRRSNGILLLQRNNQGVRAPSFEHYVGRMSGVDVEFRPMLQREVLRKLRNFTAIRKLAIKVANPQALFHQNLGRSMERLIEIMNEYEAPVAEVTLGVGYRRGGTLHLERTRTLLERLFRFHERTGEVKRIVTLGKEHEEDRTLVLDLLQDKILEIADVPVGDNRRLSDHGLVRALHEAYERRAEELRELIG